MWEAWPSGRQLVGNEQPRNTEIAVSDNHTPIPGHIKHTTCYPSIHMQHKSEFLAGPNAASSKQRDVLFH